MRYLITAHVWRNCHAHPTRTKTFIIEESPETWLEKNKWKSEFSDDDYSGCIIQMIHKLE